MFIRIIPKSRLKNGILLLLCLLVGGALLQWPQAVSGGINRGISICTTVIIPTLFPFLVLVGFMTHSGLTATIGRRLERVTRFLFGLPGVCAPGIVMGMIGGYPSGGAAVSNLLHKGMITPREGQKMLLFSVNAGPAFVISTVGIGLLEHRGAGVRLLIAHLLSSLTIGILSRFWFKTPSSSKSYDHPSASSSTSFPGAVNAACRTMLYMCGFVVLFACLQSLADGCGLTGWIQSLLSAPLSLLNLKSDAECILPIAMEVTGGCVAAATTGFHSPFWMGLALGWGGISVHCQLMATLHPHKILNKSFWLARIFHGLWGGVLSVWLFRLFPISQSTWQSSTGITVMPTATTLPAALTLFLLCILLLFTNGYASQQSNK